MVFIGLFALLLAILPTGSSDEASGSASLHPQPTPQNRIVLIGEWHGTRQGPELIYELALSALERGESVSILLEQSSSLNTGLESLTGQPSDRASVCAAGATYFASSRDGRATVATGELILAVGQLIAAGYPIQIRAMDVADDTPFEPSSNFLTWRRDFMAASISDAARSSDHTFVLVGNNHPPALQNRLREASASARVTALWLSYDAGDAWNCQNGRCQVHATQGSTLGPDVRDGIDRIELIDGMRRGFHGIAYVGPVSASRPIKESRWCDGSGPLATALSARSSPPDHPRLERP